MRFELIMWLNQVEVIKCNFKQRVVSILVKIKSLDFISEIRFLIESLRLQTSPTFMTVFINISIKLTWLIIITETMHIHFTCNCFVPFNFKCINCPIEWKKEMKRYSGLTVSRKRIRSSIWKFGRKNVPQFRTSRISVARQHIVAYRVD